MASETLNRKEAPMARSTTSTSHLDEPRVRFNWGYHDAAADVEAGRPDRATADPSTPGWRPLPAFDVAYAEGYLAGTKDAREGTYAGNSDAAWEAAQAA